MPSSRSHAFRSRKLKRERKQLENQVPVNYKRVKERKPWQKVEVPEDLFNSEGFEHLIDLQVLTDYDLGGDSEEESSCKSSKKRRLEDQLELDEPVSKKTKKKKKKNDAVDIAPSEIPGVDLEKQATKEQKRIDENISKVLTTNTRTGIKSIQDNKEKKKKIKKKKKKANLTTISLDISKEVVPNTPVGNSLNNVDDIEDDKDGTDIGEKKTVPKKKKKRKKKKKTSKVITPEENCQDDIIEESSDDDNLNKEGDTGENDENITDIDMSQWLNLHVPEPILAALTELRFATPTMIQTLALPAAIKGRKDILGAAETGSGKTLAFGIPALARVLAFRKKQEFKNQSDGDGDSKTTNSGHPLVLILEPTRELAVQVKNHLTAVAKNTNISMVTIVGGMSIDKQRRILLKRPDIIIATPGRLWQLYEEGNKHILGIDRVEALVVDEADRMVERGHYEELTKIMELLNESERRNKQRQTFVMSATLTMQVAPPKRLGQKQKNKPIEEDKLKMLQEKICSGLKPKIIDLTPKDHVSQTLTELRVNCKADEKDQFLYYFLCQHPGRTLVFCNSKDCLRRLSSIFTLLECQPLPLHADMHQRQRLKNLDKFTANSRGLLVASDVAARGLDIPKVDHVIHYQVPRTMENYIHRSGRTARASQLGLSVMLVSPEEARNYRKIIQGVRCGQELPLLPVAGELMPAVTTRLELAKAIDVQEYRLKKKKMRNNFFIKAAQDMDMILDDQNLLDEGDQWEQSADRTKLRNTKAQLSAALRGALAPLRMSKYPTKMGALVPTMSVDLHAAR